MKKVLVFAGSNHSGSINQQLAHYAASLVEDAQVELLDLKKYDAPMYSIDREQKEGHPESIKKLNALLQEFDGYIIASPEHNGNLSAFLKNVFDWLSRVNGKFLAGKPVLLLSTSPGKFGGANHLNILSTMLGFFDGKEAARFSLGSFSETFDTEAKKIKDPEADSELLAAVNSFVGQLEASIFNENLN